MQTKELKPMEALSILDQATAGLEAKRIVHAQVQQAIFSLEAFIKEHENKKAPAVPPTPLKEVKNDGKK